MVNRGRGIGKVAKMTTDVTSAKATFDDIITEANEVSFT